MIQQRRWIGGLMHRNSFSFSSGKCPRRRNNQIPNTKNQETITKKISSLSLDPFLTGDHKYEISN
jgi:hypothetical protein